MKQTYIFEYLNENDFRKKERTVRKYNMLAYKKLTFEYYVEIRNGNFLGELVAVNKKAGTKDYELKLPTDELFAKVHGEIKLHYTVYEDKNIIILTNITPEGILGEGHRAELGTYKGVMISKSNPEKDMFKVNLLNMLEGRDHGEYRYTTGNGNTNEYIDKHYDYIEELKQLKKLMDMGIITKEEFEKKKKQILNI